MILMSNNYNHKNIGASIYRMRLLLILAGVVTIWNVITAASPNGEARHKAHYYFMEGSILRAQGKTAESHELFRKAVETDPSYIEAKYAYSAGILMMPSETDSIWHNAFAAMKDVVDNYPGDQYDSEYYAYIATKLGHTDEAIRIYRRIYNLDPDQSDMLLYLAELYTSKDSLQKAYDYYEEYERIEGKSAELSLRKIVYKLNMGDTVGAVMVANSLIESNPHKAEFHILKGDVFTHIECFDSALKCYTDAEKADPQSGEAKIALANHYRQLGDSTTYDNKIYEALMCDNFDMDTKLEILAEYLQKLISDQSNTQRGDHLFEALRDQYPHEPELLHLAARYSAALEKWKEAEENISYAIDMAPENHDYWRMLMSFQIADDRNSDAIASYFKSKEYIEPNESMDFILGSAYQLNKDYPEALNIYSKLLKNLNESLPINEAITDKNILNSFTYEQIMQASQLYNIIGDIYYQMHNVHGAFAAYDNSLILFPDNVMTLNNYAYFLSESGGDLDKAEQMSALAVKSDPDNPTYLDTYAWIFFCKGEYKTALLYQEAAVEKETDELSTEYLDHLGDIYFMNDMPEKAVESWKKALKLSPDNENIQQKVKHKKYFTK